MKTVNENERDLGKLAMAIRHLVEGRTNAAGRVTLRNGQTTTTVTSLAISAACYPQLTPASATAATAVGGGHVYVSAVAKNSFTITHNNTADTDRHFHWHAIGG